MADDPKISASDVENMAKARGLTKDMLETWRESANAAERMNDSVEDLTDSLQRVLKFSDAQAKIVNQSVNKFQELATRAGDLNGTIQNLVDPTKMMYELFARSVDRFIELDNAALKFRETTGFLSSQTKQVEENIRIASRDLSQFGVTAELASEAAQQLATAFNDTAIANKENIEYVSLMKQNLGVAAEDSVSLLQNFMGIGAMTPDIARQTAGAAASLAKAAGVPLAKVMKDVATAGGEVFKLVRGSVNALIKGAVEARRLGIELKDIGAAADKFLDFQTSINSEMEASVLFGKDINFTRARELSYAGDLAGLAKEQSRILKEVGDFRKLDAFQAKALAESMGLSVDQLVKMNAKQEELNKLRIDDPALYAKYTANLDTIDKTNESLSEKYQKELKSQQLASQQQKLLASINSIMIELGEVVLPFLSGLLSVVGVLLKISTITTKFILMPFKYLYDLVNDLWIKFEPGVDIFQKMGYGLQFVIDKMDEFKGRVSLVSGALLAVGFVSMGKGFGNILMRAIPFPLAPLKFVLQKTIGNAIKGAMDVAGETVTASGKKIASNLASSAVGAAPTTPSTGPSGFLNSMKGINPATVLSLGAALIMFAGAMYILAKAGQQFNTVDWSSLGKMGVILAVLGATIAGLMATGVLETAAGGIALLGLAFIPFSISALAAGKGMQLFGQGIQSVSTGISDIASNISQIASLEDAFSVFTDTSILFGIAGMTLALSLLNEQLSKVATNLPALKNIESIKTATGGGNAEVVNKLDELIVLMKNGGIAINIDGSKVSTAVGVATNFRGAY